jgi:hypothetical protein
MNRTVTLELPDALLQNANTIAGYTHRRMEDVLIEWLELVATETPLEFLSDDELLALSDMQMNHEQQQELSDLQAKQREQKLDELEKNHLTELMQIYRQGMVRKAQARKIAFERGLQPSLAHTDDS